MTSHQPPAELLPAKFEVRRRAALEDVRKQEGTSTNARFNEECAAFISAATAGDHVYEFCSAESQWRLGLGWAGFELQRNDLIVARLITRMS
ncbi:hypothetical protein [Roseateles sp. P5_D6]